MSGIALIHLCAGGVPHIVEKFSTRTITLLQTSPRSEVFTKSYGPPKSQKSQFREFWDSQLGYHGTKSHLDGGPVAMHREYYKGKEVASLKFGPWRVLWVCVCSWLVHAPKLIQLCVNQLVVWYVHVYVNNWSTCYSFYSHPELQHAPLPSKWCELRNVPQLIIFSLFSPLDL
jgi:hypothetical protein